MYRFPGCASNDPSRQERRLVDALSSCNIRWGCPRLSNTRDQGTHHVLPTTTTSTTAEHSGQGNTHPMTVLSFQSCRVSREASGIYCSHQVLASPTSARGWQVAFCPRPTPLRAACAARYLHGTLYSNSDQEVMEKANSLQSPASAATNSLTKGRTYYAWTGRGRRRGRRKQQKPERHSEIVGYLPRKTSQPASNIQDLHTLHSLARCGFPSARQPSTT